MKKTYAFTVMTSATFEVTANSEEEAEEILQDRLDSLSKKEFANEFEDNVYIHSYSEMEEDLEESRELVR